MFTESEIREVTGQVDAAAKMADVLTTAGQFTGGAEIAGLRQTVRGLATRLRDEAMYREESDAWLTLALAVAEEARAQL